jgi:hypothetical protein
MTESRSKSDPLSQTCKSELVRVAGRMMYGLTDDDFKGLAVKKGLKVEDASIQLYSQVKEITFDIQKNEERKENDFIMGTPDIVDERLGYIPDIKSSWDWNTFAKEWLNHKEGDLNKDYYWQIQGYMELFGFEKGSIVYCLIDTPDDLIEQELRKVAWDMGKKFEDAIFDEDFMKLETELRFNRQFKLIPKEKRVIEFEIEKNNSDIERLYTRIGQCREWLQKNFGG